MDANFVGLIFSCFHDSDKKYSIKTICFRSVSLGGRDGTA